MRSSPRERIAEAAIGALMVVMAFLALYPLIHVVFASLSEPSKLNGHRGLILAPLGLSVQSFRFLFRNPMILSGFVNSVFLVVVGVSINIVMTTIAAYVLSRRSARLVPFFSVFVIFTMLFSGGLIPLFLTIRGIGLYNSLIGVIMPFAISTFNLIILRTAFESLPESLNESARLDGAGHLTILARIMMPLVMPTIAVLILYYAVDRWNSWFFASILLKDRGLYPLQLVLREILLINDTGAMAAASDSADMQMIGESIKYAAIVVGTVPILMLYPFLQRYFVKGALVGAVKE
jgi:putative aldouronate transport system permease protein